MGADPDSDADHLLAVDLVARAVAAVAVADVSRAPAPSGVRLAGEPSLCRPDIPARSCVSAAASAAPSPPASPLPAGTYALPKRMESARGWTDADRAPLCEAFLDVTGDAVKGTVRTKDNLWATVQTVWGQKVRKKGPMRVERLPSALEKQFKRIRAGVSAFTSHYLAVKAMPTTGNPSEKDIISGTEARYCSLNVYDAIREDRNQGEVHSRTRKREAKVAHCKWVACWRVLRQSYEVSGGANGGDAAGMEIMGDTSSDAEASGSGSGSGRSRRNGGFQGRPVGIKAAKVQRQEDVQIDAQVKAITELLHKLTDAQHERTALCFLYSPLMRPSPEAARYLLGIIQKMLARAAVASSSAIDVGG